MRVLKTRQFSDWHDGLRDAVGRARITVLIQRMQLEQFGDTKPVGDGVFEARLHAGPGYRIYYFRSDKEILVLLAGGDKGSQRADIAAALRTKSLFLEQSS